MLSCLINPWNCFFGIEGHVALDRNPGPGYDTLLLRLISGYIFSAFPHGQFQTSSAFQTHACQAGMQFLPF